MWCAKLILIYYLGIVTCRPQDQPLTDTKNVDTDAGVEIERQRIQEVNPISTDHGLQSNNNPPSHKKMDASTIEILEKIAEVNKNQGYIHRKTKPNYFHFPFSYSRSQEDDLEFPNFKFSRDPFTNPVFEYLEKEQKSNSNKDNIPPSFSRSTLNGAEDPENYVISMTDPNAEVKPEDHIPGQYIKRKVTHVQGFLMPNPYMLNMYPVNSPLPSEPTLSNVPIMPSLYSASQIPSNLHQLPPQPLGSSMYPTQASDTESEDKKNRTSLEKKTVENVKNIVSGSNQNFLASNFPTFYHPNLPFSYLNVLGGNNQDQQIPQMKLPNVPYSNNILGNTPEQQQQYMLQNYAANIPQYPIKARQNWNWPGSGFFPIYIRDPFLQMYYAITNMIEYGPNSGSEGPCKLTPRPQGSRIKVNSKMNSNINEKAHQVTLEMNKAAGTDEIKVLEVEDSDPIDKMRYLDVEDIDIGEDELVKFTVNLPTSTLSGGRELKNDMKSDKNRWDVLNSIRNDTSLFHLASGKLDFSSDSRNTQHSLINKPLSPIKDHIVQVEEIEDEPLENEKAEDISISNQGAKKVLSRENTGNGIFIHKLKVRQGGVAIAGPGGIATAGSGGTAIVGPNGVAYTHPDGLAIAGSGTKVVAVDPNIDLNEAIKDSVLNGTRHIPNTRVGKVVAVGPVIYYNRG